MLMVAAMKVSLWVIKEVVEVYTTMPTAMYF